MRPWRGIGIAAVAAALCAAGGCGVLDSEELIDKQSGSTAPPYDGPLKARTPGWVGEDSPLEGGGAALLTLECTDDPYEAGGGHDLGGRGREQTPEAALKAHLQQSQMWKIAPERGYRIEKREAKRVLLSYDVGGRTRAAMIAAEGLKGKDGWIVETYALCDPSEYGARERKAIDLNVWSDEQGRPVNTSAVRSSMGPEHCTWQSAEFLHVGQGKYQRTYLRDPEGVLADLDSLHSSYDGDTELPADARDTGWRHDGRELWVSEDKKNAYVRTADGLVERWPGTSERIGCA